MLRSEWGKALLKECGFPFSPESIIAIIAWCESERAHALPPTGAHWNPLDTTEPWPGASDYNSVHVRNYASFDDGLQATKATLFNGYYTLILSAFTLRQKAEYICDMVSRSPWGSHPDRGMVNAVRNNMTAFDVDISPGSNVPMPSPVPSPVPEPTPEPTPPPEDDMPKYVMTTDPESGGSWKVRIEDGAMYADDGAPYLGGLNSHPEWDAGSDESHGHNTVQGVVPFRDENGWGYVIWTFDDRDGMLHPYRFARVATP